MKKKKALNEMECEGRKEGDSINFNFIYPRKIMSRRAVSELKGKYFMDIFYLNDI
jgi:hypothetical protein